MCNSLKMFFHSQIYFQMVQKNLKLSHGITYHQHHLITPLLISKLLNCLPPYQSTLQNRLLSPYQSPLQTRSLNRFTASATHQRNLHQLLHLLRQICSPHAPPLFPLTRSPFLTHHQIRSPPKGHRPHRHLLSLHIHPLFTPDANPTSFVSHPDHHQLNHSTLRPLQPLQIPSRLPLLSPILLTLQPKLELHPKPPLVTLPIVLLHDLKITFTNLEKSLTIWPTSNPLFHKPSNKLINTLSGEQQWKLSLMFYCKIKRGNWYHMIQIKMLLLVSGCSGLSER